jgi:hypothetical protein
MLQVVSKVCCAASASNSLGDITGGCGGSCNLAALDSYVTHSSN